MTSPLTPELLDQDRGLDAAASWYPSFVRSVFLAPWHASASAGAHSACQLFARTAGALNEVAHWANDGQAADPTACAWLAYLRWAVRNGAKLPADAPHPPADDLDRDFPFLTTQGEHSGDSLVALATGHLGEVARPVLPLADSPEVLTRTVPYGLVPNIAWKSLIALAVDSAAITHGSAEAQTAAAGVALAVHAAARARDNGASLQNVVEETSRVVALMTRPAPVTRELLGLCADRRARHALLTSHTHVDGRFAQAVGDGTTASSALALGLASILCAEDAEPADGSSDDITGRALALLSEHPASSDAARTVALSVTAARWGLADAAPAGGCCANDVNPCVEPARENSRHLSPGAPAQNTGAPALNAGETRAGIRRELLALADRWLALWQPRT